MNQTLVLGRHQRTIYCSYCFVSSCLWEELTAQVHVNSVFRIVAMIVILDSKQNLIPVTPYRSYEFHTCNVALAAFTGKPTAKRNFLNGGHVRILHSENDDLNNDLSCRTALTACAMLLYSSVCEVTQLGFGASHLRMNCGLQSAVGQHSSEFCAELLVL